MNQFKKYSQNINFYDNSLHVKKHKYTHKNILSLKNFEKAKKEITSWEGYNPTRLFSLENIANSNCVSKVYYKDESSRFGLKSFKALGGAYAVANLLICELKKQGIIADSNDLFAKKYLDKTSKITVSCATDGNHGRSVAWGASVFGCKCEIFIHAHVSQTRKDAISQYGAIVHRVDGNYDESVRVADEVAKKNGYFTISDTSYEGYTEVPKDVMQGYTIMVDEALYQMKDKPTHIFLQGGVGGMAAAVVSFVHETYEEDFPIFVIVEPKNADCLFQSAKNKKPTVVKGELETIMAGLSCGEVSLIAWDILKDTVLAFMSIEDNVVPEVMKLLARNGIVSGESAVAGLAGFLIASSDEKLRKKLQLDMNSKVLCFGTEGDTDELMYKTLVNSKIRID
jgi:diaminopropionate ammonia-lyase